MGLRRRFTIKLTFHNKAQCNKFLMLAAGYKQIMSTPIIPQTNAVCTLAKKMMPEMSNNILEKISMASGENAVEWQKLLGRPRSQLSNLPACTHLVATAAGAPKTLAADTRLSDLIDVMSGDGVSKFKLETTLVV